MAHDIFISYSSNDKPIADAICAHLESENVRVWMAPRDILPGRPWAESIIDAINSSSIMVVIVSYASNASKQVTREVERAVNKGIIILPFRVDAVQLTKSLEFFLSSPHWLDALTPPMKNHIEKLTSAVKSLMSTYKGKSQGDNGLENETPKIRPKGELLVPEIAPDQWGMRIKNKIIRYWLSKFEDH